MSMSPIPWVEIASADNDRSDVTSAPPRRPRSRALDAVTRLLSDLVAIPSVNPMGRPLGGPGFLEAGMTDYLEGWFRDLGVPASGRPSRPGATTCSRGTRRRRAGGRSCSTPIRTRCRPTG